MRQTILENYNLPKSMIYYMWMIEFSILPKTTSMWVDWNLQHHLDKKSTEPHS